jgi:mono/diheme cytochrome c family protein
VFTVRVGALAGIVLALMTACGGSSNTQATSGSNQGGDVPRWVQAEHLPQNAVAGASVFASAGCTACHIYAGSGHSNLGAPELTSYGRLHTGKAFDIRLLRCPACVEEGSQMPRFDSLGDKRLRQLAVFLEASKGTG